MTAYDSNFKVDQPGDIHARLAGTSPRNDESPDAGIAAQILRDTPVRMGPM
jgi:hypothetical protein